MEDALDHCEVVAIRRAFYQGLGRTCLNAAWARINVLRENRGEFLGRSLQGRGISQRMLADAIDRTPGEMCRWLQGQSPQWANLMVVMFAMEVGWNDLGEMPPKVERKRGGYLRALLDIRRRLLGDMGKKRKAPRPAELWALESLFCHPQWEAGRRIASRREKLLKTVAEQQGVEESLLDAADQAWGEAFAILQQAYLQSVNVALWR